MNVALERIVFKYVSVSSNTASCINLLYLYYYKYTFLFLYFCLHWVPFHCNLVDDHGFAVSEGIGTLSLVSLYIIYYLNRITYKNSYYNSIILPMSIVRIQCWSNVWDLSGSHYTTTTSTKRTYASTSITLTTHLHTPTLFHRLFVISFQKMLDCSYICFTHESVSETTHYECPFQHFIFLYFLIILNNYTHTHKQKHLYCSDPLTAQICRFEPIDYL